jgi:hypothetical protein
MNRYRLNERAAEIAGELGIRPDLIRHTERDGHEYIRPMYGTLGEQQHLRMQALAAGFVCGPNNRPEDGPRCPSHFRRTLGAALASAVTRHLEA